jgi:penicillin-binding protein 1A
MRLPPNAIAAQLVERVGPDAVIDVARRSGINSSLKSVYSLALGTSGVSPLEMASAFATYATGGVRHEPFWILRVEDPLGRVLEEQIVRGQRSLDAGIGYQVVDMMRGVLTTGTGRIIRRTGFDLPAAGKTGTSDDYRDAWFTESGWDMIAASACAMRTVSELPAAAGPHRSGRIS